MVRVYAIAFAVVLANGLGPALTKSGKASCEDCVSRDDSRPETSATTSPFA